jgi:hypothetical protein
MSRARATFVVRPKRSQGCEWIERVFDVRLFHVLRTARNKAEKVLWKIQRQVTCDGMRRSLWRSQKSQLSRTILTEVTRLRID